MGNLTTFDFDSLAVRVVDREGQPWFVAADVCKALGISNTTVAMRLLDLDERARFNLGLRGLGAANILTESGLYKLIMRSDKPQARKFQDWVTKVVLPAIRKDGAYVMGEEKVASGDMSEDEFVLRAIEILQGKIQRLTLENKEMSKELNLVTIDEYRALTHRYFPPGSVSSSPSVPQRKPESWAMWSRSKSVSCRSVVNLALSISTSTRAIS